MPTVTTKSGRCQGNPRRMTSVKPAYQREANIYPACLNPWRRATAAPQSAYRPNRLTRPPTLLPGYTLYEARKIFSIFNHHRAEYVEKGSSTSQSSAALRLKSPYGTLTSKFILEGLI